MSAECDDADPSLPPTSQPGVQSGVGPLPTGPPKAPLQQQPMPQGGPPNLPPPPGDLYYKQLKIIWYI